MMQSSDPSQNKHIHAHDTHVYLFFYVNQPEIALQKPNACLSDIRSWMIANRLKISFDKTELIIIGSASPHNKL